MQGLNTEYERLRKESEGKGAGKGASSAASEGPSSVQGLRKEIQSLQVPFLRHLKSAQHAAQPPYGPVMPAVQCACTPRTFCVSSGPIREDCVLWVTIAASRQAQGSRGVQC